MRNFSRRKNQEARVVSNEANIPSARLGAPSYITVAAAQMTRGRTPCHTGDRASLCPHQTLQVFAYRLLIAKIVMLFHQAVEQRFVGRLSNLLQKDRTNGAEWCVELRHVDQHRLWSLAPSQGIGRPETNPGQLDLPGTMQHQ